MDVYQLQWFGYCLFRALACLHKQDLQSKYTIGSKSKSSHNVSINHVPLPHSNSAPTIKDDKLVNNLDDYRFESQVLVLPLNVDRRGREI
ncbi:uncharacterized protein LOC136068941 isoform X5 [Quercus suber]